MCGAIKWSHSFGYSFIQKIFEHLLCANVVLGAGDMPRGDTIPVFLELIDEAGKQAFKKKYYNYTQILLSPEADSLLVSSYP